MDLSLTLSPCLYHPALGVHIIPVVLYVNLIHLRPHTTYAALVAHLLTPN